MLDVVTLEDGQFLLDGKPFLLYSGEIHYFRLRAAALGDPPAGGARGRARTR